jgi:CheY-like chemotaxis protein
LTCGKWDTKVALAKTNETSEWSPPLQSPIKILIIDDNEIDRYTIKNLLLEISCTAIKASNGYEGLELARTEQPQVILLDLLMPDLTGFEVLEQLKLDANTRDIPVIIISSMNLETSESERLATAEVAILNFNVGPASPAFLRGGYIEPGASTPDVLAVGYNPTSK